MTQVQLNLNFKDHELAFLEALGRAKSPLFNRDVIKEVAKDLGIDPVNSSDMLWEDFHSLHGRGLIEQVEGHNEHFYRITNLGKLILFSARSIRHEQQEDYSERNFNV